MGLVLSQTPWRLQLLAPCLKEESLSREHTRSLSWLLAIRCSIDMLKNLLITFTKSAWLTALRSNPRRYQ